MGGGADDGSLALARELELEHGSSSKNSAMTLKTEEGEGGEDAAAEMMELDGRKVERSGDVTPSEGRTDDDHHDGEEVLTIPVSRVRSTIDEPLGKKLAQPRNPSQKGSELQQRGEKRQGGVAEPKLRHHNHHQAQRPPRPSSAGNSTPVAMSIDNNGGEKTPAGLRQQQVSKDVQTNETKDEAHGRSGKQVPRYGSENLDSSPDYGRREAAPQGNSRHICKYCAKEFASGRALGGHMRAHGSLTVEEGPAWTMTVDAGEKQLATGLAPHFHSSSGTDSRSGREEHEASNANWGVKQQEGGGAGRNSKRSRNNHNGKEIQAGRSGGRRSKHKRKRQITPKNSDDEVEDTKQLDQGRKNAAAATAPMTEVEPSVSSGDDGNNNEEGTDEENGGGVTDGAAAANNNNSSSNVCNVCDQEFENGKQLNSHKKSHDLYGLRRNPKRSRRFMDQDYTAEAAAVAVPAKKTSSMFTPEGEEPICSECFKRFQSWKALFGHMRCHPERHWRGIHRPDAARDRQQQQPERTSSSAERQLTSSRRRESSSLVASPAAEILPNSPSVGATAASPDSDSESALGIEASGHGKGLAAVASDNDSDTESIEAAYMNGERQPASSTWIWMTGKRSKRSRQTVKSLQVVSKTAPVPAPPTPAENNEMAERETAMGLMMLARKQGGGDESWFEEKRSNDNNMPSSSREPRYRRPSSSTLRVDGKRKNSGSSSQLEVLKETHESAFSETEEEARAEDGGEEEEENEHEAEEVVDDDEEEDEVDDEDERWADLDAKNMEYKTEGVPIVRDALMTRPRRHLEGKAKAKLEAADNASLCEENEELGGDVSDAGELGGGSNKPKYQCNSCKRSFKSHQALGGHRASHKKVKGCYARTNVSDGVGVQENPDEEEMMSEDFSRSDEQLQQQEQPQQPIDSPQDRSQSSEDDVKEPQLSAALAKENSDEMTNNTNNGISTSSRSKGKGHPCTLCGRTFNSGQALGGHKRCHYNNKEATSSEATSSNNTNKQQQPQLDSAGGSGVSDVATVQQQQSGRGRGKIFKEELNQQVPVVSSAQKEEVNQITQLGGSSSASDDIVQASTSSAGAGAGTSIAAPAPAPAQAVAQSRPVKEKFLDLNLPAPDNDDEAELEAYAIPPAGLRCELNIPVPTKLELKGTVDYCSNAGAVQGTGSSSSEHNRELLEMQRGQPKGDYLSLYHNAGDFGATSLTAEEKSQEIGGGGGQESSSTPTGFRGAEVDFGLRYVRCNICDKHFSTVEALSNHEKTHARIVSSVSSGLTPISA